MARDNTKKTFYIEQKIDRLTEELDLDRDIIRVALELGIDEDNIEEAYQGTFVSRGEFLRRLMEDYIEQDGYYFEVL